MMLASWKNAIPNVPASAVDATQKHTYVPSSAHPAKKPARGPSVTPENAYTDPAWLKYRDSRMNAYATSSTPIVAKMNASGTARPISPAGAVPLSAIAAVGAMIAIEIAIVSQNFSSRRSPADGCSWTGSVRVVANVSLLRDLFEDGVR